MVLRRVVNTSTLRLVLVYLAVFGVSVLALLGFLYVSTAKVLERQTADTIQAEIAGLAEQYRAQGIPGLRRIIEQRSAAQPHRASIYLLTDPRGRPLAGNLTGWPDVEPDAGNWLDFTVQVPNGDALERRRARAASFSLTDGYRLLVGREIEDRLQIQSLVKNAIGWGLALTLLLGLAYGFVISFRVLARIDAINRTMRRIVAGELGRRIVLTGSGNEFDQLAANVNVMLNELERLRDARGNNRSARSQTKR